MYHRYVAMDDVAIGKFFDACANNLAQGLADRTITSEQADELAKSGETIDGAVRAAGVDE